MLKSQGLSYLGDMEETGPLMPVEQEPEQEAAKIPALGSVPKEPVPAPLSSLSKKTVQPQSEALPSV